jgi:hypothetical protein
MASDAVSRKAATPMRTAVLFFILEKLIFRKLQRKMFSVMATTP